MNNNDSELDSFGLKMNSEGMIQPQEIPQPPSASQQPSFEAADSFDASFDPFGIAELQKREEKKQMDASPKPPPEVSRITRSNVSSSSATSAQRTGSRLAIPPKMVVKLAIFEDVSSVANMGPDSEGASETLSEGTVYAQVQCSDALKNAPFAMVISTAITLQPPHFRPNPKFTTISPASAPLVQIPKHEIGYVPIGYYSVKEQVQHMPILLERKVTVLDTSVRVAVQVRTKLTNNSDLEDFSIAVAVPERVDGESIEILHGDGEYDKLKRMIKWKLPILNKGESFMVSAQGQLWKAREGVEDIRFPVLMRCRSSADQISSVSFEAVEADGYPSALTANMTRSFRLLHRLT